MSDDDPWGTGEDEETPAEVPAAESAKATPKAEGTPAAKTPAAASTPAKVATPDAQGTPKPASKAPSPGLGTPGRLPEGDVPAQDDIHIRRPLVLYKHWVRYVRHAFVSERTSQPVCSHAMCSQATIPAVQVHVRLPHQLLQRRNRLSGQAVARRQSGGATRTILGGARPAHPYQVNYPFADLMLRVLCLCM